MALVTFVGPFSTVRFKLCTQRTQSHIDCICLAFLHCAFGNVISNALPEFDSSFWVDCKSLKVGLDERINHFPKPYMIVLDVEYDTQKKKDMGVKL